MYRRTKRAQRAIDRHNVKTAVTQATGGRDLSQERVSLFGRIGAGFFAVALGYSRGKPADEQIQMRELVGMVFVGGLAIGASVLAGVWFVVEAAYVR